MPIVDFSDPANYHNNELHCVSKNWQALNNVHDPECPQIFLRYNRASRGLLVRRKAARMAPIIGVKDGDSVLLVGDTFAWMAEAFQDMYPASTIVSTDISPWAHSVKDQSDLDELNAAMDAAILGNDPVTLTPEQRQLWIDRLDPGVRARRPFLDEDLLSQPSRNAVRGAAGLTGNTKFDWAISTEALLWLEDAECQALSAGMRGVANRVMHLTITYDPGAPSPEPEPAWNRKYLFSAERDRGGPVRAQYMDKPWYTSQFWKPLLTPDQIISAHDYTVF